MKCPACPAAGRCVVEWSGHVAFCGWAASGDPRRRARVAEMSVAPPPVASAAAVAAPDLVPVAESLALLAAAKRCPFRSTAGCGCGGAAKCALKGGAIVFLPDCFECIRRHGD